MDCLAMTKSVIVYDQSTAVKFTQSQRHVTIKQGLSVRFI